MQRGTNILFWTISNMPAEVYNANPTLYTPSSNILLLLCLLTSNNITDSLPSKLQPLLNQHEGADCVGLY